MCDPATAMAVLMAVKAGADHNGQVEATEAQNKAARQTQANAATAARNKYLAQQQQFIDESRAVQQEGYDADLAKEAALSTGVASAANAGVTGISVDALLASEVGKGAVNQGRIQDKMNNLELGFLNAVKGSEIEAQSRIDAAVFQKGPSLAEGVLNVAVGAASGYFMGGGTTGTSTTTTTAATPKPIP